MPDQVPGCSWSFPPAALADEQGLVAAGGDLEPGTILHAYRRGLFPMPLGDTIGWWSPDPRGIIPLDGLIVSRSLRRSQRRYQLTVDEAFGEVITACADPSRKGGWISGDIHRAYTRLHRKGWAHSVEAWEGDRLVGGVYGIGIGAFFAGESMFHRATDASKVALVGLVDLLNEAGAQLLDVQWCTPHLGTLGAVEIPRSEYLARLREAVDADPPDWDQARPIPS